MAKQKRRIKMNFRQTKSERSAGKSYQGFGKYIRGKFNKFVNFK